MSESPFYRARCYAVRDAETKERLSYRYFDKRDLPPLSMWDHTGRVVEYYTTSMNRPRANRGVRPMITFTLQPEARPMPVCTSRNVDQLRDMARRLDTRASGYRMAGEAAEAKRHRIAADTARLLACQLEALR